MELATLTATAIATLVITKTFEKIGTCSASAISSARNKLLRRNCNKCLLYPSLNNTPSFSTSSAIYA
ncbi:MAG: hypothetical protein ACHBN1_14105 [Heteroscytonema crispum UTEX LB 1556]